MSVRIKHIAGKSGFFRPGDEIVSIDGIPLEDQLDLIFNLPAEGSAIFTVRRESGRIVSRRLTTETFDRAALQWEEMHFARCRSRCPFCFVDQMPPGLRSTLYEKDDDYRLSFLFGNFITLNDVSDEDIARIVALNLSPLYISVHAVDRGVRERLFGRPMRGNILDQIGTLADRGITMHAQVVLVPGINDGSVLEETLGALFRFYPACRSLAVVPVGLTAHRGELPDLAGVSEGEARELIRWATDSREGLRRRTKGERFLHLADEFYLMAGEELPSAEEYDGFPQISNGVGMCRMFISDIEEELKSLSPDAGGAVSLGIVSGRIGTRFIERYILPLVHERAPWIRIELITVENRLFGESVGVSGLLAGRDIIGAVREAARDIHCLVLPPNAVNHRGLMIDDVRPGDIEGEVGIPVLVPQTTFLDDDIVRACRKGKRR